MMIRLPSDADKIPLAVLAAGDYPVGGIAASILMNAGSVVCCDGAAAEYIKRGGRPYAIVGDFDSLHEDLKAEYAGIIHCSPDQESNDLTKAVEFCVECGFGDIVILGATGRREDHTLANVSLLAEYVMMRGVRGVRMLTDLLMCDAVVPDSEEGYSSAYSIYKKDGLFPEFSREEFVFESRPGQQVSIFTPLPGVRITTRGLSYPLENSRLNGWWSGTLNESLSDNFSIETTGPAIVCRLLK